jgi:hypothetical protein
LTNDNDLPFWLLEQLKKYGYKKIWKI